MTQQLTFLHAADLHIGAPFRGVRALSPSWAEKLSKAILEAYDRLIDIALEHEVEFVVIAGDVFDNAQPSYADFLHFVRGLSRLDAQGIPVYLCTGNHDPHSSWRRDFSALPANTYMFSSEAPSFVLYERDGEPRCVLGGRSYQTKVWSVDESITEGVTRSCAEEALGSRAACAPFGVGVVHTGLHLDHLKAPADPSKLLRAGFDYWALGHIHRRWIDDEANPRLVFPGCIQGRDIKETGPRGVTLVTLTQDAPNEAQFVPTAHIAWEQVLVDISSCETLASVVEAVMRAQFLANGKTYCERMIVRVTLAGQTPLHDILARPGVLEDVRNAINDTYADFFCDAIIDRTVRVLDRRALREEGLFPSTLMAAADALREQPSAIAAVVQEGMLARNFAVPSLSTARLESLVDEAEELIFDMLVKGERL